MTLKELLDEYGRINGIPEVVLDANDMCRLRFRETIDVDIEPSKRPGHVHLYTVVGRVPPSPGERYFRKLLEANLFGRDTGAASLACDPDTDEVLLWRLLDIENLRAEAFDLCLQDFVESAAGLVEKLQSEDLAEPVAIDNDSMFMNTMHMRA